MTAFTMFAIPLVLTSLLCWLRAADPSQAASTPEERAAAWLLREVPRWNRENRCYSCHNNGDGARALYRSARYSVPARAALADTSQWLSLPASWDDNKGDPRFSDKLLARLQFTAALAGALESGLVSDGRALEEAGRALASLQGEDGSWRTDQSGNLGSPITYGTALATVVARNCLERAGAEQFREEIARASRWLLQVRGVNVPDAAALVLGFARSSDRVERSLAGSARTFLLEAQSSNGGWGPYRRSTSETFDTALALLALSSVPASHETMAAVRRGRAYLLTVQNDDGSWNETTRPPGAESYAQRVSTTAWALQALYASSREIGEPTWGPHRIPAKPLRE